MNYQDERTKNEFSKNGTIKALFFLIAMLVDIVFKVKAGQHFESIIILAAVTIISAVIGVIDLKRKELSVKEILSGYKIHDERVIAAVNDGTMKTFVFGYIFIFVYCIYSAIRFSLESITAEGLLFIVMSAVMGIESRFVNKNAIASTYAGNEAPYYDDNKKGNEIKKRIIATWSVVTAGWIALDIINYKDIFAGYPFNNAVTYVIVFAIEILTTAVFAYIDVKLMRYVNKNNIEAIDTDIKDK